MGYLINTKITFQFKNGVRHRINRIVCDGMTFKFYKEGDEIVLKEE